MATLSSRMKKYEYVTRTFLTRRSPVIIRIDGKAFHSFTRKFQRPFDEILRQTMVETCKYLCANIMGCKLAYTQSDEISLLLINYEKKIYKNPYCNIFNSDYDNTSGFRVRKYCLFQHISSF